MNTYTALIIVNKKKYLIKCDIDKCFDQKLHTFFDMMLAGTINYFHKSNLLFSMLKVTFCQIMISELSPECMYWILDV